MYCIMLKYKETPRLYRGYVAKIKVNEKISRLTNTRKSIGGITNTDEQIEKT